MPLLRDNDPACGPSDELLGARVETEDSCSVRLRDVDHTGEEHLKQVVNVKVADR